jgi:hypothetical protein
MTKIAVELVRIQGEKQQRASYRKGLASFPERPGCQVENTVEQKKDAVLGEYQGKNVQSCYRGDDMNNPAVKRRLVRVTPMENGSD